MNIYLIFGGLFMFTSAFLWALQSMAVPSLSIILSMLMSKYLESKEKTGLATLVTGSVSVAMFIFYVLPLLNNLSMSITHMLNLGSGFMSSPNLSLGHFPQPTYDFGAVRHEVINWATDGMNNSWNMAFQVPQVQTTPFFSWARSGFEIAKDIIMK
jgi:hypothetical protein